MVYTLHCDRVTEFPSNVTTDICSFNAVKWQITAFASVALLGIILYLLRKWRYRCHKTLLTFHNLRAALAILLLAINTLELARALLPFKASPTTTTTNGTAGNISGMYNGNKSYLTIPVINTQDQQQQHSQSQFEQVVDEEDQTENDYILVVIGETILWNALAAILFTIMTMIYHRVVELKKITVFLYVSSSLEVIVFFLRIYELAEIVYNRSIFELEPFLQSTTALCLLGLAILDGYAVYKERYRPDYLEDYDKIGYKHTLATFYSKICYWWLTPLLWFGYNEPLELEDLGQMRVEDTARAHYDHFLLIYKTAKVKNNDRAPSLWLCYLKSSWRMFTLGGILKLFGDLFALIGPLAIQQIVQYIETMYGQNYAALAQLYASNNNTNTNKNNNNNNNNSISMGAYNNTTDNGNTSIVLDGFANAISNNTRNMRSKRLATTTTTAYVANINRISRLLVRATGSIWPTTTTNSDNNVTNQIATAAVHAAAAAASALTGVPSYNSTTATITTFLNDINEYGDQYQHHQQQQYESDLEQTIGTEVQIYYPSWLDLLSNGWVIAWLVLLGALAQGALSQASTHVLNMTGVRIKTSLQGLIYRKTLLLNSSCIANAPAMQQNDKNDNVPTTTVTTSSSSSSTTTTATAATQQISNTTNVKVVSKLDNKSMNAASENNCQNAHTNGNNTNNNTNNNSNNEEKKINANDKHNKAMKQNDNENVANDIGAITNLMSVDTLNVMSFFCIAHYVWAIPLKIGLVMCLLYQLLGISAIIGSFVCIFTMTPLQFLIGKAMSNNTEKMAKYTDERLKRIHDTFVGIKIIKLNAWDEVFLKRINAARAEELKYLNRDSIYWTLMTILTHICSVLITFVTLAFYVWLDGGILNASRLFSALALFQQLTVPLLIFPITVPIIIAAVTSTKRLEHFLLAREIQKQFEGIRHMARILSKSDASLDIFERTDSLTINKTNNTATTTTTTTTTTTSSSSSTSAVAATTKTTAPAINKSNQQQTQILRIQVPDQPAPLAHSEPHTPLLSTCNDTSASNCNANKIRETNEKSEQTEKSEKPIICMCANQCDVKFYEKKRQELLRNSPYVIIRPRKHSQPTNVLAMQVRKHDSWQRESLLLKMPDNVAVSVREANFAWNPKCIDKLLSITDMVIPRGGLTVVVGKTGSGKTSLLSALLMEMPLISGDMIWNKTSTISYVPQQPWLLNANIRENILFGESFRPKRYDFVLAACALKPDIELMPAADLTMIGERGINLSGGQRQRVAIARALYSSANVVIMDDPLSSLDNEVAHHVFERSIKRMLLRTNRTVILVTQQLSLVQQADYLIVMKDGRLQASGSYKDIEIKHSHIIAKWNAIIAKANETEQQKNDAIGRTARERWKLFKNVSKLSLQRSISLTESTTSTSTAVGVGVVGNDAETEITATATTTRLTTGTRTAATTANVDNNNMGAVAVDDAVVVVDDDDDVLVPVSMPAAGSPLCGSQSFGGFAFTRKRSSVYGSRHLIYDVPLPIDECQTDDVIMRRRRRSSTLDVGAVATLQTRRRRSSRFSGISASSTDTQRRSLLTASCSSATSCTSSNASCYSNDTTSSITSATKTKPKTKGNGKIPKRANSWQPQSKTTTADVVGAVVGDGDCDVDATDAVIAHNKSNTNTNTNNKGKNKNKLQHQPVTRNISSPGSFCYTSQQEQQQEEQQQEQSPHATNVNDGILIADLVQSTQLEGGFQQFLRRMSMRRSNKPSTVTTHRIHRPLSATNSILSISEETPSPTTTSIPATTILPTIELSRVATEAEFEIDTETVENIDQAKSESWITNNTVAGVGADNVDRKLKMVTPATVSLSLTAASVSSSTTTYNNNNNDNNSNTATLTAETQTTTTTTITPGTPGTDTERKYGEIPAKIYLLYLRASGPIIVLIFFISALIWQGLRVYTDMWLRQWSDNNIYNNNSNNNNRSNSNLNRNVVIASRTDNDNDNDNDIGIGIGIDTVSAQHEVTYYFSVYAGISCVCIVMALISTPAGQLAGCLARRNLHEKLLQAIMHKSLHFFQLTPLGRIMNRFSNDMAIIDMKIAATSQRLLQFTLLCLCAVLINVVITPWFILLTLPICVAYYIVQKFYRCSARELQRIENSTNSPIISHLAETIQGVTTIRAYNQEARFTEILFRRLEANTIAFTLLSTSNRWLGISLDYLGGMIVFVAIVTALLTATVSCSQHMAKITDNNVDINSNNNTNNTLWSLWHGEISPTPSLVGLAINYTLLMPIYLNWVVKYLADMEMYVGSVERIAYYTEEPINSVSCHINVASDDDKNFQINNDDDGDDAANVDNDKSIMQATIEEVEHKTPTDKEAATMKSTTLTTMECNDAERRESLRRISVTTDKRYKTVPISWPQRGDITFEHVSLRYEGQTEYVIKDFNLHIPAGQRLGICGRTGSGKSTLALSLFGVLQTSGRIYIDDVDITQIHPDEMRTRLSIIPQDVHLFSATIRENLDPHGYYSDLALWNCLELAQLKEFVNAKLSAGLDTRIMDGGIHLSTGHRQLFCLARAILRGSVCLVLDEATSALDSSTERALLTTEHRTFHGRTIISIAHRLSTILDYDRIIVMENGRIIDDGHPQELQRRTNSAFYALLHAKPTQLLGVGDVSL